MAVSNNQNPWTKQVESMVTTTKESSGNSSKKSVGRSSTERSKTLAAIIKEAGGAVFTVRCKSAMELGQIDALVSAGYGANRNDVILKLVAEKAKEIV